MKRQIHRPAVFMAVLFISSVLSGCCDDCPPNAKVTPPRMAASKVEGVKALAGPPVGVQVSRVAANSSADAYLYPDPRYSDYDRDSFEHTGPGSENQSGSVSSSARASWPDGSGGTLAYVSAATSSIATSLQDRVLTVECQHACDGQTTCTSPSGSCNFYQYARCSSDGGEVARFALTDRAKYTIDLSYTASGPAAWAFLPTFKKGSPNPFDPVSAAVTHAAANGSGGAQGGVSTTGFLDRSLAYELSVVTESSIGGGGSTASRIDSRVFCRITIGCTVASFSGPQMESPVNPGDETVLVPALQEAVRAFRTSVSAADPKARFEVTSTKRPVEYQAYLYEIKQRFDALQRVQGVDAYVWDSGSGLRPQLRWAPESDGWICQELVDETCRRILRHKLVDNARVPGISPAVNPAGVSNHDKGLAVDISITSSALNQAAIDDLARRAGLKRPNDAVHYELLDTPRQRQAVITGESPIRLLVRDPANRRVGFDASIGAEVNEIPGADYSGGDSHPQVIHLPVGAVLAGNFQVSGIGTGTGSYKVTMRVWGEDEDPDQFILDEVIASGDVHPGQPFKCECYRMADD